MKQILAVLLLLSLVSCANVPATGAPAVVALTTVAAETMLLPTLVPSVTPSRTPTTALTPEPSCDPFRVDFCVTEGHFILQRPIQSPGNALVDPYYRYGSTADGTRDPHHGVEFPNASGTPVYAAADGTVVFAGNDEQAADAAYAPWGNFYGNLVVIEHPDGLFTLYAHLSRIDVQAGQNVAVGQKIGEVGRTGGAIGSHLHFEVRLGDVEDYFATQNPELWLVPAIDSNGSSFGVLQISVKGEDGQLRKNANFTIGHYLDRSQLPDEIHYATSYSSDLLNGSENTALSELSAGLYRIVVETNGQMLERWVEVESGKLTQVVFVVK